MEIEIALNLNIVGKPKKNDKGNNIGHNGQYVNLGSGWMTESLEIDDVWNALTADGFAIGPALVEESNGIRNRNNFKSHQIVCVDIDGGMRIEDLFNDDFYEAYALGFYTTPSHTEENPRFRIVFLLEEAITSEILMRQLYTGMMALYESADEACKDGSRLFYGTPYCQLFEYRNDKVLPLEVIIELIEVGCSNIRDEENFQNDLPKSRNHINNVYAARTAEEEIKIVECLRSVYVGQYMTWRNIGWGMRDGGFSLSDFEYVTNGMMNKKNSADCKKVWNGYSSNGGISFGTVIHFLQENCPNFKLTTKEKQQNKAITNSAALLNKLTKSK
jgi:hypothetical protein